MVLPSYGERQSYLLQTAHNNMFFFFVWNRRRTNAGEAYTKKKRDATAPSWRKMPCFGRSTTNKNNEIANITFASVNLLPVLFFYCHLYFLLLYIFSMSIFAREHHSLTHTHSIQHTLHNIAATAAAREIQINLFLHVSSPLVVDIVLLFLNNCHTHF